MRKLILSGDDWFELTPAQMQRLSDIAYGMALAKEGKQEERKEA